MQILKLNRVLLLMTFSLAIVFRTNPSFAESASKDTAGTEKITVRVDGLSCPFCAYGLEKKLKSLNGVEKLEIKINDAAVFLFLQPETGLTDKEIKKKIKEAGFTPREITRGKPTANSDVSSQTVTLKIEGMTCQGCTKRVKSALEKIECSKDVSVSLDKNQATVVCTGDQKDRESLVGAVEKLGFKASLVDNSK